MAGELLLTRKLDNWIQSYLVYSYEQESPEDFHRWIALSVIAGALRRQVFFDMGYFLLYPNMYIILVSPAGVCKKSTAMRMGRSTMEPLQGIKYSSDSTTRERLIMDMTQAYSDGHSAMSAFSSEFASLLTSSQMDMVVFLTDIYDSPSEWSHRTKMGGTNKIVAPCLNLLGATTPDWMAKAMPLDTVGIGLTSRIVFVYSQSPRIRDPFPVLSDAQKQLYSLLVEDLGAISAINGEYKMDAGADELYRAWYKGRIKNPNTSGDPRLNGYFMRKPMHVIKVSMAIAASQRDELIITKTDLEAAFALLESTEAGMPRAFANVGKNPLNVDTEEVLAMIISAESGIGEGDLLRRMKHSLRKDELDEVISALMTMRYVRYDQGLYYPNWEAINEGVTAGNPQDGSGQGLVPKRDTEHPGGAGAGSQ